MPALQGQIIMTLPKEDGTIALQIVINFDGDDPGRPLVSRTVQTTDGARSGALVVDNQTDRAIRVVIAPDDGPEREVSIPKTGAALSVAQCAAQGYLTQMDFNGLSVDWAA